MGLGRFLRILLGLCGALGKGNLGRKGKCEWPVDPNRAPSYLPHRSSALTLVPAFTQLSNRPSCLPTGGAAAIAISALHLCLSHVTLGDPGAGAGQGPAPS